MKSQKTAHRSFTLVNGRAMMVATLGSPIEEAPSVLGRSAGDIANR